MNIVQTRTPIQICPWHIHKRSKCILKSTSQCILLLSKLTLLACCKHLSRMLELSGYWRRKWIYLLGLHVKNIITEPTQMWQRPQIRCIRSDLEWRPHRPRQLSELNRALGKPSLERNNTLDKMGTDLLERLLTEDIEKPPELNIINVLQPLHPTLGIKLPIREMSD